MIKTLCFYVLFFYAIFVAVFRSVKIWIFQIWKYKILGLKSKTPSTDNHQLFSSPKNQPAFLEIIERDFLSGEDVSGEDFFGKAFFFIEFVCR
jgi:hypothetical protein